MRSTYLKLAVVAIVFGSAASAFAGAGTEVDGPASKPTLRSAFDGAGTEVDGPASKPTLKSAYDGAGTEVDGPASKPTLRLGVRNSALADIELADPDNEGSISRVRLTLEASPKNKVIYLGPKKDNNQMNADILPVKVIARFESETHGDLETVIDLAQVSAARLQDGDADSKLQLDVLQFKFEENNDENLGYSETQTLNLISVSIQQLVAQGLVPGTSIPVKLSILGGLDLGLGKSNGEGAEVDSIFTYRSCAQAELSFSAADVMNQICGTYVDAGLTVTGQSGIDSTATTEISSLVKFHTSPFNVKVSGVQEDYDNGADTKREIRIAVQLGIK